MLRRRQQTTWNLPHWWRGLTRAAIGLAACAAVQATDGAAAHASGITLGKFGGIFGHANAEGGLAMYWNPARLSVRPGWFATVDATLVRRAASYDRILTDDNPFRDNPGVRETNEGLGTIGTVAVLPYLSLGGTADIQNIRLGFAVGGHPAFGGTAAWDKNPDAPSIYPGAQDGPQRWTGITSSFLILQATGALSVTLLDHGVSFGVAASYIRGDISTVRARNVNRSENLLDERGVLQEGRVFYQGDTNAFSMQVGMSYDHDNVTLSATYRHSPILSLEGNARQAYGTQPPIEGFASLDFPLPHTLLAAMTLRYGSFEATGAFDYSMWSRMRENQIFAGNSPPDQLLLIPRELEDTFSVRGILGYNLNPRWNLSMMLGIDPSAVPTRTMDASLSDAFKVQVGGGFRAEVSDHLRLFMSLSHDFYREVQVRDSIQEPSTNGDYNDARTWLNLMLEARL